MARTIGIDFGTALARAAVIEGGIPRIIRNKDGEIATPSIVSFTDDGGLLVGEGAKRHGLIHAQDAVFGVKRLMGVKYRSYDVDRARPFLPYELVEGANGDAHVRIGATVLAPAEITSHIFRSLRASAEEYLGEAVEAAVVAVPAAFGHGQRAAIREAGLAAGLTVRRLVGESTAAGVAHGFESASDGRVAMCDFGAGKIDVAILEMVDGLFQVRAVGGDGRLGGVDLDRRIAEWVVGELQRKAGRELELGPAALQWLSAAAEDAKQELSTAATSTLVFPAMVVRGLGERTVEAVLTRDVYEQLTNDTFEDLEEVLERCLGDSGSGPEQIDEVRLVGAQARDPRLKEIVRRVFGRLPKRAAHDDVVAMGAALLAGMSLGEVKECVLLDVAPHAVGIETKDGGFTPFIERNRTIPTRTRRVFTTITDAQTRVRVHVLLGESETAAQNESLGSLELADLAPEAAGVPQIEVTVDVDVNAEVSVEVKDQSTGRSQSMALDASANNRSPVSQARRTEGAATGLAVVPVFWHTLGIENADGSFTPVLMLNTRLPARASRIFTTVADNQARVEVYVRQGDSDVAAYNKSLALFELTNLPPAPQGVPRIEVTFEVDGEDEPVSVSAKDLATGRSESIVIPAPKAIGRAIGTGDSPPHNSSIGVRPSVEKCEPPPPPVARVELLRQVNALVFNTLRSVRALAGKLTPEEQQCVLEAVEGASRARADGDTERLRRTLAELEMAAGLIARALRRP